MANNLRVYNHLNYKDKPSEEEDKFIEFLFEHTDLNAPEVDESKAWDSLNQKIHRPNRSFTWMKVAAAVAILAILSVTVYMYDPVITQIEVAAGNEKVSVTFPDGSTGILNANSSFSYPEKFGEERNVSFNGEAYFDIKKSEKPFIIDVNGVDVKVLGTAFNLITTNNNVTLYVDRGLVAFEKDGKQTQVQAGKEAIFNRNDGSVELKDSPSSNIMSWRNGVFNFNNTPLDKVLDELSEYYEVEFELSNEKLNSCKISVTFNRQTLQEVLSTLSTLLDLKTTTKNSTVKISGQGC
ncbi:FecR family protein [Ekhidna sp.]|uniref:FecR family protein n=1 Tax=Ekhidna sp. TaxID=2608089 RepID=UPI003B507678